MSTNPTTTGHSDELIGFIEDRFHHEFRNTPGIAGDIDSPLVRAGKAHDYGVVESDEAVVSMARDQGVEQHIQSHCERAFRNVFGAF